MSKSLLSVLLSLTLSLCLEAQTEADLPMSAYHIYAGSTHAHTSFTASHGAQFVRNKGGKRDEKGSLVQVSKGAVQTAAKGLVLRPDWQKVQGPPAVHFAIAKKSGYDFYVTSDHSQDVPFHPISPTNAAWLATKQQAREATDADFVALAGYEHSENNGPGGKGHINVINSDAYLNALMPGIDLRYLYNWLPTAKPNGEGPVVAVFNHPGPKGYNSWAYRTKAVTDVITMLEVINGNDRIHYDGFVAALDHGWKVSPVCGHDNHGTQGIAGMVSRTFVLATNKTKMAILDAMKHRRTYAALDSNIQCRYAVNGKIMGSALDRSESFRFEIEVNDPDTDRPKDKITKLDVVKDGGTVVQSYSPEPAFSVRWNPVIRDSDAHYFFVRVWSAGGGDVPNAKPKQPVSWLAPVWVASDRP